jgi:deoxyribose-phosphate aldolase
MTTWTIDDLCQLIDHTNLKPNATSADMRTLCDEARQYHFRMVAIESSQVARCAQMLKGTDVHVGAAISFPLGQTSVATKVFETKDALANGATEIDYVVNRSELKSGNWDYVRDEMQQIVDVCSEAKVPSKVIFETQELTKDEKIRLCQIAAEVKPTFVKTSTGFSPEGGATLEDVELMRANVPAEVSVKAAGGIRDADTFLAMVKAGARRIGCSAGIPIIKEIRRRMDEQGVDHIEL